MARVIDPETGGLQFEERADLSPEFDFVQPKSLKMGFVLPRDVDFFVVIGRHRTEADFATAEGFIAEADMLMTEGIGQQIYLKNNVYDELTDGNERMLEVYLADIEKGGFVNPTIKGFEIAKARSIFRNRIPVTHLDPGNDNKFSRASEALARNPHILPNGDALLALNALGRQRDQWCLNNLKKLVDAKLDYVPGERRKVVITRGFGHLRLLRALEYQCEYNPKKANGSQVLSSCVNILHDGDSLREHLMAELD